MLSASLNKTFVSLFTVAGSDRSASFYGWSIKSLKGVVSEAGAYLEKSIADMEERQSGVWVTLIASYTTDLWSI